jgi:hypothetical protein
MKTLAAVLLPLALAACGAISSSSPPLTSATAVAARPPNGKSWMRAGAAKQPTLLYVSNVGAADVTVYTYSDGGGILLVGTLTGFAYPSGLCTDTQGNVWVLDYGTRKLYKYAHGGDTPIQTIEQHNGKPYGCAVDLKTGNLAVASALPDGRYSYGTVKVYAGGKGRPQHYDPPYGFRFVDFLAYDNQSNLLVDGEELYHNPGLFELPKYGNQLLRVSLSGGKLQAPAAVQWDKPIFLVGDQDFQNQGTPGFYKVFLSGSAATVVGSEALSGTQKTYAFWRRAGNVIVPDYPANIVRIYRVSDGSLVNSFTDGLAQPFGAVVSQLP